MAAYLLRRTAASVVVLIGISVIIFFLLHLVYPAPGLDVLGIEAGPAPVAAWMARQSRGRSEPACAATASGSSLRSAQWTFGTMSRWPGLTG